MNDQKWMRIGKSCGYVDTSDRKRWWPKDGKMMEGR